MSLASLVMASSFPCCEIRQLLVHVYPGSSKAPGAERITIFYGRRGRPVKKPASSRLSWPISGRGSCRPVASAPFRCFEPAGFGSAPAGQQLAGTFGCSQRSDSLRSQFRSSAARKRSIPQGLLRT